MQKTISLPEVIRLAACHTCCSKRGEPCVFTRSEDPFSRRAMARKSHDARVILAKRIAAETQTITFEDIIL